MARFGGSSRVAANPIAAGVAETILQLIAAANHLVVLVSYALNGKGISNTETPGEWDLIRQSTAGTSVAGVVTKDLDSIAETLLTTSLITFTVEPTSGDILRSHTLHPQTNRESKEQYSREKVIGGSDRKSVV